MTDLYLDTETLNNELCEAQRHIIAALDYHDILLEHRAALEQMPMYPAIPTEQWQKRNGKGDYLYLIFKQDRNGQFLGPNGKRKVYVGNKPERIAEARELVSNRREYEECLRQQDECRIWLHSIKSEIAFLLSRAGGWKLRIGADKYNFGAFGPAPAGRSRPQTQQEAK
jgi:hypothetical protein